MDAEKVGKMIGIIELLNPLFPLNLKYEEKQANNTHLEIQSLTPLAAELCQNLELCQNSWHTF